MWKLPPSVVRQHVNTHGDQGQTSWSPIDNAKATGSPPNNPTTIPAYLILKTYTTISGLALEGRGSQGHLRIDIWTPISEMYTQWARGGALYFLISPKSLRSTAMTELPLRFGILWFQNVFQIVQVDVLLYPPQKAGRAGLVTL